MSHTTGHLGQPQLANDLQSTWTSLQEGIDTIMNRLEGGISPQKYIELYT